MKLPWSSWKQFILPSSLNTAAKTDEMLRIEHGENLLLFIRSPEVADEYMM